MAITFNRPAALSALSLAFLMAGTDADAAPKKQSRPTHKSAATQKIAKGTPKKPAAMHVAKTFKPTAIPTDDINNPPCPYFNITDNVTGQSIVQSNADVPRPLASMTKILTATVMLEVMDKLPAILSVPVPAQLSDHQLVHLQRCTPESGTTSFITRAIDKLSALKGMLIVSHNTLAKAGGAAAVKAGGWPDFPTALRSLVTRAGLNDKDLHIAADDMDGIQSARDCNIAEISGSGRQQRIAYAPIEERGTRASMAFMTAYWNYFRNHLPADIRQSLQDPKFTVWGATANNTNPWLGLHPDIQFETKTGTVTQVYNILGTATHADGRSISFSMSCPSAEARRAMGPFMLKHAFPRAAVPQFAPAPVALDQNTSAIQPVDTAATLDNPPQNTP